MTHPPFCPPFPALTAAQRYHLEIFGYVVVEGVLGPDEVASLYNAMHNLKDEFIASGDPWNITIRGSSIEGDSSIDRRVKFRRMIEATPEFLQHAGHQRIVGMAEEVVGARVRLTEQEGTINSRDPDLPYNGPGRYLWHRNRPSTLTYEENGLFHCSFVKSITNLSDLGPGDGGTCVIAGSHKVSAPEVEIVKAARENPSLIHQVATPAGSTLIFCETLLHSAGDITSDNERTIIINGYQPWNRINEYRDEFSDGFRERVPEPLTQLIFGSNLNPRIRRRPLGAEVGSLDPGDHIDSWSLETEDPSSYEVVDVSAPA